MRTIKELLQVVLDNPEYFRSGLCNWIYDLKIDGFITHQEQHILEYYISQFPTDRFRTSGSMYYWESGLIKPRIEWLKEHIKLQEQK